MTALQIDTDASRHASSAWASWADHINAAQMQIGRDIEPLGLARAARVCSRIAGAATELWTVSGFLTLLVEQLEAQGIIVALRPLGVRVSPHFYNTEADIARLLDALPA